MPIDIAHLRRQFPILKRRFDGHPLCYLDNAATTQKPQAVIDAIADFYSTHNANVNRGVHPLAEGVTDLYDRSRDAVRSYIGARRSHEIIFTRNATEAINLVARTWGEVNLERGDVVALSVLEHHSNIVPWLQLKARKDIRIRWIGIDDHGHLVMDDLRSALKQEPKLLTITGLSNVLGTSSPLTQIIADAHRSGTKVLVDASQLIAHAPIDVQALDADFLAFSGHKVYGPMGIGALYGKASLLRSMPPFLGGGDMIQSVTESSFTTAELPRKFEAGTPSVADAVGLAAALMWMRSIGMERISDHEQSLLRHAQKALSGIRGLTILGPRDPEKRSGCIAFTIDGVHPHDLTDILGREGICLRAGHHCAQPLHHSLKINASTRLSVATYNTVEEVERCAEALERAVKILR